MYDCFFTFVFLCEWHLPSYEYLCTKIRVEPSVLLKLVSRTMRSTGQCWAFMDFVIRNFPPLMLKRRWCLLSDRAKFVLYPVVSCFFRHNHASTPVQAEATCSAFPECLVVCIARCLLQLAFNLRGCVNSVPVFGGCISYHDGAQSPADVADGVAQPARPAGPG